MSVRYRRGPGRRGVATLIAVALAAASVVGGPVTGIPAPQRALAAGTFTDPYFREFNVFTGLSRPVSVRFASDGRAFVAEKAGVVKAFDSVTDTTPTTVIALATEVNSYWDRGLLGIAVDPGFLSGRPYLYLYFVYDAPPGEVAPVWNDACSGPAASPPGPGGTQDGCVVTSRLERITLDPATNVAVPGSRLLLIHDWCQQYPSHAGGGMAFGPDGQLYLSGGDGASFNGSDYGQRGGTLPDPDDPITPVNPCGDPTTLLDPNPDGTPVTEVATAEGGMLRSQDVRTGADPTGLGGTLIRIDPDTGEGSAGNPLSASTDANNRRIVAHGFRNAFRWTFRPGTTEVYLGDVGNQTWEEIERIVMPGGALTRTTLPNFGWPCYEGVDRSGLESLGLNLCTNLYGQAGAVTAPLYQYSHWTGLEPTGPCFAPGPNGAMGSSVTGLAFYDGAEPGSAPYPARYDGALFFADYSRDCLAVLLPGAGGVPDPSTMEVVATGVGSPVDLVTGPGGDLYYVDIDGGRVVRIRHLVQPIASATVTPQVAAAPVDVTLDASASTDPDPTSTLTAWNWDLDHDGSFTGASDRSGEVVVWHIETPAVYPITLQVVSSNGLADTLELVVDAEGEPPVPSIDAPDPSLTWAVGDTIPFAGSATDPEDGTLPASALSWDLVMRHCPADCHDHVIQTFEGVAAGSIDAPDHEYPSHLELRLTATDSHGTSATTSIELHPQTSVIGADSSPAGIPLFVAGEDRASPSETTVIRNGTVTIGAPLAASVGGRRYRFSAWSDGLPRTHDLTAAAPAVDLLATFLPDAPDTCASATTVSPRSTWIGERTTGAGDTDWFRFSLGSRHRVVVSLGDLPVDARLDLYAGCSTLLASSDHAGLRFEELTRTLGAGTYRVRVTVPGGATSAQPWVVRFRPMAAGLPVKSSRTTRSGDVVRVVGEVLNNTGRTRGAVTVTATFRSAAGEVVGTLRGRAFEDRTKDGGLTSFALAGRVPVYASMTLTTTSVAPSAEPALALTGLSATANGNGTVSETGSVRNTGSRTARNVKVARTWYGTRGEVLGRGIATLSPSTLGAGRTGTFTLTRPVLGTVQGARTQLRGGF
ncbi:MAG: hypothetical protein A2V85_10960 [Chloroflexi bacterium RBG_16_72_14]|nr:MAG: hypothetical protein A2V85_10960 [Chloroflexi bacterium RBG_16_72_14]